MIKVLLLTAVPKAESSWPML